ncbi:Mitogen-activated protein kinase kinase 2 [Tritrichomonas foetus]|uniref:mitogen-activated protein kinase kinase n=1 Tax=Tritrichomonas foetus TaxID=1144522 RepID=A0A1J4L2D7_9EUKA|nr:Mitogen-activated protein kinase kinase 2 [Tritrichomonas foetus]|eukprot:OHT17679.1 Mitogen-activated protein kinase kinase 2 [Tritrichomonas foetus]
MSLKARRKISLEPVNTKSDQTVHTPPPTLPNYTNSSLDDYELKECLGSGSQSTVFRVVKKDTGESFALKKIRWLESSEDLQKVVTDIHCLNILRHPNIVRIYTAFYVDERIQILMSYNDGLCLADYLRLTPTIPEPALGRLVWCALQGLSYLRRNHFLHRDLKPSNILLSKKGEVKIADFGMARHLQASMEQAQSYIGTISYMAPERINNNSYSFKSDIWSLGMIAYQCAIGKFPYPGDTDTLNLWELKEYLQNDIQVKLPSNYSELCEDFITSCLKVKEGTRASVEDLVKHPWALAFKDESANGPLEEWVMLNTRKRESEAKSLNSMSSLSAAGIRAGPR